MDFVRSESLREVSDIINSFYERQESGEIFHVACITSLFIAGFLLLFKHA